MWELGKTRAVIAFRQSASGVAVDAIAAKLVKSNNAAIRRTVELCSYE